MKSSILWDIHFITFWDIINFWTKNSVDWIGVCKLLPDEENFERLELLWSLKVVQII